MAIRVDVSQKIGLGHLMRCLTLADSLLERGAIVRFICRDLPIEIETLLFSKGHEYVHIGNGSSANSGVGREISSRLAHTHWLSASQTQDADDTVKALADREWDWLIVDHYALDARWESTLTLSCRSIMVIDDLADRHHVCDLLLDQTFGRSTTDYRFYVQERCKLLCGSQYALLRPEFATMRSYSLRRRAVPALRELLVCLGGVDKDNVTGQLLQALRTCNLPTYCRITVIMGDMAPWLEDVRNLAQNMTWPTQVLVGVRNMAKLMSDCDLAIGAAGATSWERCCLGVPTIMLMIADNQLKVADSLNRAGAAILVDHAQVEGGQLSELFAQLLLYPQMLISMSNSAASIVDGMGTNAVLAHMGF